MLYSDSLIRCVRNVEMRDYEPRHIYLPLSSCPSVCLSTWSNSAATGRIFMKFDLSIFENLSIKFKFR